MKISVIIPVYNEKSTISEIIARVRAVDLEKEIIIVDDGSTDGTSQQLAQIGSKFGDVNVLSHQ
ncbi:MAG: glycosyltransferase, partial [Desulfobacterales bacterium]|nr:glycosyltransferase [Desulfobacterales bacterium]